MFTKYCENDLLELFGKEPTYIGGKEAGIFIYTCTDADSFTLTLTVSIYEKKCDISLDFKNKVIFSFSLKDVSSLESKEGILRINRISNNQTLVIRFIPSFSLLIENI